MAELRRRLGRDVVVQLEEPALARVVEGGVPTTSGLDRIRAVEPMLVQSALRTVRESVESAGGVALLRQTGATPEIGLIRGAGFTAIGLEDAALGPQQEQELAELVEAGATLLVSTPAQGAPREILQAVAKLWRRVGLDAELGPRSVVLTHQDGFVHESPQRVIAMLKAVRQAGQWMAAEPEEWLA